MKLLTTTTLTTTLLAPGQALAGPTAASPLGADPALWFFVLATLVVVGVSSYQLIPEAGHWLSRMVVGLFSRFVRHP